MCQEAEPIEQMQQIISSLNQAQNKLESFNNQLAQKLSYDKSQLSHSQSQNQSLAQLTSVNYLKIQQLQAQNNQLKIKISQNGLNESLSFANQSNNIQLISQPEQQHNNNCSYRNNVYQQPQILPVAVMSPIQSSQQRTYQSFQPQQCFQVPPVQYQTQQTHAIVPQNSQSSYGVKVPATMDVNQVRDFLSPSDLRFSQVDATRTNFEQNQQKFTDVSAGDRLGLSRSKLVLCHKCELKRSLGSSDSQVQQIAAYEKVLNDLGESKRDLLRRSHGAGDQGL